MIGTIGFVVLGQSAVDDIVPAISKRLPPGIRVLSRGALDGLSESDIESMAPREGDYLLVCKVQPGREAQIVFDKVFPCVQESVRTLEAQGADLVVVLCGANWTDLQSSRLLINPGAILPQMAIALGRGKRLGVIMPTIHQVESIKHKYRKLGATDLVATHVTLYDRANQADEVQRAADYLVAEGVDLVWMPCLGMGSELRDEIQQRVNRPVILAQSMLARVINELVA